MSGHGNVILIPLGCKTPCSWVLLCPLRLWSLSLDCLRGSCQALTLRLLRLSLEPLRFSEPCFCPGNQIFASTLQPSVVSFMHLLRPPGISMKRWHTHVRLVCQILSS